MTIRTRIEVDVTGLSAQIDAIKNKLGEITTAARGGEYKLNTQQAERDVGLLLRQLDKLDVLRDNASRHNVLLPVQSQDMARIYRQAANTVNRVNRQSGTDEPVDWLRTAADEHRQKVQVATQGHGPRQRRQSQYELLADGADQLFSPIPPAKTKPNNAVGGQPPTASPVDKQLDLSLKTVANAQNIMGGDGFIRMAGGVYRDDNKQAQRGIDELAAQYDALEKSKKRQGDLSIEQAKRLAAIYRDIAKNIDAINQRHGLTQTAAEPIRKAATEVQADANRLALNQAQGTAQPLNQHGDNPQLNLLTRGAGVIAGAAIGGGGAGSAIGSLLGSLLPGPLSLAGSAVGGAIGGQIDKGLSGAETEAVSYHYLRNQLGNAAVDFDVLRDGVRKLTEGLGVGYNESVKLAQQFARTAAATPDAAKLGKDLQDAIGFGRSYGVDPSAAVDFFAQQRLAGVTNNESDNKRLAVQIAEAVGRGGGNAKMTEMLSVISNFTQKTAYESLITPDVSTFTSLIGTMINSGTPGLANNPTNAANLLGQANAGFAGSGGDAQNMFMMLALQHTNPHFTGFDLPVARSAGLLASPSQYLGKDSLPYQLAEVYQDWQTLGRYNKLNQSTDKNLTMIIKEGERNSTGSDGSVNTNMLSGHVQQQTKLDMNQANALILSYQQHKGFGGLEAKLKDFSLDEKTLGTQKLGAITPLLLSQGSGAYLEQYQQLRANDKVTQKDQKRIAAIKDTGSKEFKQEVLKLVMDNATDEGDKLLKVNADMADNLQKLASQLIPATIAIKEGITEVVRWVAKIPGNEKAKGFVAREDLTEMGRRYGVDVSDADKVSAENINKLQDLEKLTEPEYNTFGNKIDTDQLRQDKLQKQIVEVQQEYRANSTGFPEKTPEIIESIRKRAGFGYTHPQKAESGFFAQDGAYYALPLTGYDANYSGDANTDTYLADDSYTEKMVDDLKPPKGERYNQTEYQHKIDTFKAAVANDKTHYDAAATGFLDHLKADATPEAAGQSYYGALEKKPSEQAFRAPPPEPQKDPSAPVYAPPESQPSRLPASGKGLSEPPAPGRSLSDAQLDEAFAHPHTIAHPAAWLGRASPLAAGADIGVSRGYQKLKPDQRRVADKIAAESAKQGHHELANFITATALSESSLNQSKTAQSRHGVAKGVFQFIPETAERRRVNPSDEDDNIRGGVELFIENRKKFNSIDKAIAAHLTGLDYTDRELNSGGPQDPLHTNGMEKAAAVERLALAFTPERPYREKPPIATDINVLDTDINVTGAPKPGQEQAAIHSNEDERNQQLYRELYPEQAGKGNTPTAPSINVMGAPEKTGAANDSSTGPGIIIPWTVNKTGKVMPKINTGKTVSTKAAPIISDKPTANPHLSWAIDNKIKNQDRPDKIPDNLFAAAQKEAEKTMRFRFNPLAVNIALTDRLGNPMTDNIISSNFGLPRPSGTS